MNMSDYDEVHDNNNKMYLMHGKGYNWWQPQARVNNKIRHDAHIQSNWDYRTYLQRNADYIRQFNSHEAYNATGISPFAVQNTQPVSNSPFVYSSVFEPTGYPSSDLKESYLTKVQRQARMMAPTVTQK